MLMGNGGVAPRILHHTLDRVPRLTPWPLHYQVRSFGIHWLGGSIGPHIQFGLNVDDEFLAPLSIYSPVVHLLSSHYND